MVGPALSSSWTLGSLLRQGLVRRQGELLRRLTPAFYQSRTQDYGVAGAPSANPAPSVWDIDAAPVRRTCVALSGPSNRSGIIPPASHIDSCRLYWRAASTAYVDRCIWGRLLRYPGLLYFDPALSVWYWGTAFVSHSWFRLWRRPDDKRAFFFVRASGWVCDVPIAFRVVFSSNDGPSLPPLGRPHCLIRPMVFFALMIFTYLAGPLHPN